MWELRWKGEDVYPVFCVYDGTECEVSKRSYFCLSLYLFLCQFWVESGGFLGDEAKLQGGTKERKEMIALPVFSSICCGFSTWMGVVG